jgi:hypothetical protein
MTATAQLCAALAEIPGVEVGRTRFGGKRMAWRIDGREFAHLHSDSRIDLRLPRALQKEFRGDPRARFRAGQSQWMEFEFRSDEDVAAAAKLARAAATAIRERR